MAVLRNGESAVVRSPERQPVTAYVGLGSNLDDPPAQLRRALDALRRIPGSRLAEQSGFYSSAPMGPADQPDFINGVARLETRLSPHELLHELQRIEQEQGRVRTQHWGPRTLDLDLLLYGDQVIESESLRIPHPGIADRPFVLVPLREIAPDLQLPGLGSLEALASACPDEGLRPYEA